MFFVAFGAAAAAGRRPHGAGRAPGAAWPWGCSGSSNLHVLHILERHINNSKTQETEILFLAPRKREVQQLIALLRKVQAKQYHVPYVHSAARL